MTTNRVNISVQQHVGCRTSWSTWPGCAQRGNAGSLMSIQYMRVLLSQWKLLLPSALINKALD